MLKSMHRHIKVVYFIFAVVTVCFVFWVIGSGTFGGKAQVVATVGGTEITSEQFWKVYQRAEENMEESANGKADDNMRKALKLQVLSGMIQDIILSRAARKAGITVTDQELRQTIMSQPAFQIGNVFSERVYRRTLAMNRMKPNEYEASLRRELLAEKMRRLIEDPVSLSPAEIAAASNAAASPEGKKVKILGKAVTADVLQAAMLRDKRERAFASFIEGISKRMKVTENLKPIS